MRWTSCSLSGPQSLILCVIPWFIGIIIVKSRNSRKGVGSPLDISPIDISRISPEFYSLVSDSARQFASKDNQSEHSTNYSNSPHSSSSKELTLGYSKIGSGNITSLSARRGDDAKKDEDWLPDWYTSNDDIGTMLRKRREKILHRCQILKKSKRFIRRIKPRNAGRPETLGLQHNFHNLQYCATYKGGYTFWKHVYHQKLSNSKQNLVAQPVFNKSVHSPHTLFTVTRNPWHRLESVWRDRFGSLDGEQQQKWMKGFCRGKSWPSLPPFSEFIEHCILGKWNHDHSMNAHWSPVLERCQVCSRTKTNSFDFFIAQENMNVEADYLLTRQGMINASLLLPQIQGAVLRKLEGEKAGLSARYQDNYRSLSSSVIEQLRRIYEWEIYLFDYPSTPFVKFPRA